MLAGPKGPQETTKRPPSHRYGQKEACSFDRRVRPQDPRLPGAEEPAAGLPAVRPGLRDDEAAVLREDAARAGLAGRAQGESPLLAAGRHEALRSGPRLHPQVVAGGPHGAQLLADH